MNSSAEGISALFEFGPVFLLGQNNRALVIWDFGQHLNDKVTAFNLDVQNLILSSDVRRKKRQGDLHCLVDSHGSCCCFLRGTFFRAANVSNRQLQRTLNCPGPLSEVSPLNVNWLPKDTAGRVYRIDW